jgi:hypothetical protein
MFTRTPGEGAQDLRSNRAEFRAGRVSRREHLEFAKAIWIDLLTRGLADELVAEIEKSVE